MAITDQFQISDKCLNNYLILTFFCTLDMFFSGLLHNFVVQFCKNKHKKNLLIDK